MSKEAKHSAWKVSAVAGGGNHIVNVIPAEGGKVICKMSVSMDYEDAAQKATLIAAAPDLLAAAQAIDTFYVWFESSVPLDKAQGVRDALAMNRAAIAKATK